MDRDFLRGNLALDFPTEPFRSAPALLIRSAVIFFSHLPFLAAVTLLVFLPGKLVVQFASYLLDVPTDGILSYFLLDLSDLLLGALVAPAVIYRLVTQFRTGKGAGIAQSLRWGRRQWGKTLWNKFKVEVTVALWSLLLFVPGLMAMVRLALTDAIVAIEADREPEVLERSRALSKGHRWRIFAVLLPVMVVELAATFLALNALSQAVHSRVAIALGDSLLAVGGQWTTVVVLLMYLGLTGPVGEPATKAAPVRRARKTKPARERRAA